MSNISGGPNGDVTDPQADQDEEDADENGHAGYPECHDRGKQRGLEEGSILRDLAPRILAIQLGVAEAARGVKGMGVDDLRLAVSAEWTVDLVALEYDFLQVQDRARLNGRNDFAEAFFGK